MSEPQQGSQKIQEPQRVRLPALNDDRCRKILGNEDHVLSCYLQIIAFEIVRLRGLLNRKYFPSSPAEPPKLTYDKFKDDPSKKALDGTRKALDGIMKAVNDGKQILTDARQAANAAVKALDEARGALGEAGKDSPNESEKPSLSLPDVLKGLIDILSEVSARLTVKDSAEWLDPENNPHLITAIGMIQEKMLLRLVDTSDNDARDMLIRSFGAGSAETAREGLKLIIEKLLYLNAQTGTTKGAQTGEPKSVGYVFNPHLPASMGALASGEEIIYLGLAALTGSKTAAELAADLIHEGSHTIASDVLYKSSDGVSKSTVDFVYINCDGHFYLPGNLTVINAANYEQVAREMLGLVGTPKDGKAAAAMHELKAPPLALAHALLCSRAARAWVRANDLATRPGHRIHDGNIDLTLALPREAAELEMHNAWYLGLYEAMAEVMNAVNKSLVLRSSNAPDATDLSVSVLQEHQVGLGKVEMTFADSLTKELSPEKLAMLSLAFILREQFGEQPVLSRDLGDRIKNAFSWSAPPAVGSPVQIVYDMVSGIERLDRKELRGALAAYYGRKEFSSVAS